MYRPPSVQHDRLDLLDRPGTDPSSSFRYTSTLQPTRHRNRTPRCSRRKKRATSGSSTIKIEMRGGFRRAVFDHVVGNCIKFEGLDVHKSTI